VSLYTTKHQGLAALCRFALGEEAHVSTTIEPGSRRASFTFNDEPEGTCDQFSREFFSNEGASVSNARALCDAYFSVRWTISAANKAGGIWRNEK
jgi:hypothetical protein